MGVYFYLVCAQKDGFVIREHKLITIGLDNETEVLHQHVAFLLVNKKVKKAVYSIVTWGF